MKSEAPCMICGKTEIVRIGGKYPVCGEEFCMEVLHRHNQLMAGMKKRNLRFYWLMGIVATAVVLIPACLVLSHFYPVFETVSTVAGIIFNGFFLVYCAYMGWRSIQVKPISKSLVYSSLIAAAANGWVLLHNIGQLVK